MKVKVRDPETGQILTLNLKESSGRTQPKPVSKQEEAAQRVEKAISSRESSIRNVAERLPGVGDPSIALRHPVGTALNVMMAPFEAFQGLIANPALALQRGEPEDILTDTLSGLAGERPARPGDVLAASDIPGLKSLPAQIAADIATLPGGAKSVVDLGRGVKSGTSRLVEMIKGNKERIGVIRTDLANRVGRIVKGGKDAEVKLADRAHTEVLQLRKDLGTWVTKRSEQIWKPIDNIVTGKSGNVKVNLKDLYDEAVSQYGPDSPQVSELLRAFNKSSQSVKGSPELQAILDQMDSRLVDMAQKGLQNSTEFISMQTQKESILAKVFEGQSLTARELIGAANNLGKVASKSAKAGKEVLSSNAVVAGNAKNVIYNVLKKNIPAGDAKKIDQALEQWKVYATERDQWLFKYFQPFSQTNAPTQTGVDLLTRASTGRLNPGETQFLNRLKTYVKRDPTKNLVDDAMTMQGAPYAAAAETALAKPGIDALTRQAEIANYIARRVGLAVGFGAGAGVAAAVASAIAGKVISENE